MTAIDAIILSSWALPFAYAIGIIHGLRLRHPVENAQQAHIETLKELVAAWRDNEEEDPPDDDPGDGEEPGPLQINVHHVSKSQGNVIPILKKTGTK